MDTTVLELDCQDANLPAIVTLGGAVLFVLFGVIYLREAWVSE